MVYLFFGLIISSLIVLVFGIVKFSWGAGSGYRSIINPNFNIEKLEIDVAKMNGNIEKHATNAVRVK